MNEILYLKKPTVNDRKDVEDFKNECFQNSNIEKLEGSSLIRNQTFDEWLNKIQSLSNPETLPEGYVLGDQYLTFRKSDNKLVGMVQIRHYLTDKLLKVGGHIGDCTRPSERNKGYATEQIRLALEKCRELNIDKVLLTCNKNNIASARTIQKNGGILENEIDIDGKIEQRYWIDLTK